MIRKLLRMLLSGIGNILANPIQPWKESANMSQDCVYALLRAFGPLPLKDIAKATNLGLNSVKANLRSLHKYGEVWHMRGMKYGVGGSCALWGVV